MKSVLLGFVAAGAVVLSTAVATIPASAAPVTSAKVTSSTLSTRVTNTPASRPVPNGQGSLICSGDLCIQRVTSIVNHEATIKAWASYYDFYGHFALYGPDGWIANSGNSDQNWIAGGNGYYFEGVAEGNDYYIIAWQGSRSEGYHNIGKIPFGV